MKKVLIITSAVILILIAIRFSIIKWGEIARAKGLAAMAVAKVELAEIENMDISKTIEIPGRVESSDKVELVARIDGYLQKKHFQEGDFVKKGQVLFTIEPTQYLNALNKARADVETAKAVLYKAQRDYDRGAELVKKDFISKSTYDGLYADKLRAAADVKAANAALAEAQRNYSYTTIKSPVNGKIGSLQIQEGNYVTAASGTLATVTKVNPIYVKYSVDSKQFKELENLDFIPKKGEKPLSVDIILPNNEIYSKKGVQDFLDNQVSTTTGTIDFRATFDNSDNALIPGDFVKVLVYSNKVINAPVVPQNLSLQDSKGRYVYIINEKGLAEQKYFEDMGQYKNQDMNYWIVKNGLNKGDKYISTSITKLMPNMKVEVIDTSNNTYGEAK